MLVRNIVIMFVLFSSLMFGQQTSLFSLDTPVDAKSISMGESFVAVNHPLSSLMYNPASFSEGSGITASFTRRRANFFDLVNDFAYTSYAISYNSPIGEFGFLYNRFYQGEYTITTASSPEGIGKAELYDHLFLGKYSTKIGENISIGMAVKVFNTTANQTEGIIGTNFISTSSVPVLFDAGVMYNTSISRTTLIKDNLTLGLSLQNFGTDYRQTQSNNEVYIRLPHYGRVGFSYMMSLPGEVEHTPSPLSILLTAEYKNLLNTFTSQDGNRDFWGFGSEITFYNLLHLRLGGEIFPYNSVYGNKGVASLRYGAGINFPLKYLGIETPISFHIDYAGIPTNSLIYNSYFFNAQSVADVLQIFSVGLDYPISNITTSY